MLFIAQKKMFECGYCVVDFILKNYKNINNYTIKTTKNIPLSTISILLSDKLVENKLKYTKNRHVIIYTNFPVILHCNGKVFNHYVVLLDKIDDCFVIYDPSGFGFKKVKCQNIINKWSGYCIKFKDLTPYNLKNRLFIPYFFRMLCKFLLIDIVLIIILLFLFY